MEYEYEKIESIEAMKKNVERSHNYYNAEAIAKMINGVARDNTYTKEAKEDILEFLKDKLAERARETTQEVIGRIMTDYFVSSDYDQNESAEIRELRDEAIEILGDAYDDRVNAENIAHEEGNMAEAERLRREQVEAYRREAIRRQQERQQENRNRSISEYGNDELLSRYTNLARNVQRMVEFSAGRPDSREKFERYQSLRAERDSLKAEILKRKLNVPEVAEEKVAFTKTGKVLEEDSEVNRERNEILKRIGFEVKNLSDEEVLKKWDEIDGLIERTNESAKTLRDINLKKAAMRTLEYYQKYKIELEKQIKKRQLIVNQELPKEKNAENINMSDEELRRKWYEHLEAERAKSTVGKEKMAEAKAKAEEEAKKAKVKSSVGAKKEEDEIARLEKEMQESGKKLQIYRREGKDALYAEEWSKYTNIIKQIQQIKNKDEIARLEAELRKIAERRQKYKESGNEQNEAYEDSQFAKITDQIRILKGEKVIIGNNTSLGNNTPQPKQSTPGVPVQSKKTIVRTQSNNEEEISIVYNAEHGKYSVDRGNGNTSIYVADAVNGKKKLKLKEKMQYINSNIPKEFADIIFAGMSTKAMKAFDPNLVNILFKEFGGNKEAAYKARDYLLALDGRPNGKLAYKMTYDLRGLDDAKYANGANMGMFDKARIKNLAEDNKKVATIIGPDKNKASIFKRAGIAIAAGILGILTIGGINSLKSNETELLPEPPKVTDDSRTPETTTITNGIEPITTVTEKTEPVKIEEPDFTTTIKYDPTITTDPQEPYTTTTTVTKVDNEEIKLGTVLQLPEGLQFQEGMDGGRIGDVGNIATPKDGFYVIDRTITRENGTGALTDRQYGLNGGKIADDSTMVHVSYVEGAKTLDEAIEIINKNKDAKEENMPSEIGPRGWVSTKTIRELYKEQNRDSRAPMDTYEIGE